MDYSRIPEELKNQNQWVCAWDGSKVPMRAFERKAASSTAPDTWSTFEQAEWAVENGHYDHIGYVFADQNIVGIDIDAGFEDGLMTPLCADIMQACHSYTEKSRSGRGVHILMRGKLPFSGKSCIYFYSQSRSYRVLVLFNQRSQIKSQTCQIFHCQFRIFHILNICNHISVITLDA